MNIIPKKIRAALKQMKVNRLIKRKGKFKNPNAVLGVLRDLSTEEKLGILPMLDDDTQFKLAITLDNDVDRLKAIDLLRKYKKDFALELETDDARLLAITKLTDNSDKLAIAEKIQTDNKRLEAIDLLTKDKGKIAQELETDDARVLAISRIEEEYRAGVIIKITEQSIRADLIDLLKEEERLEVACSIDDPVILVKVRDKFEGKEKRKICDRIIKLLSDRECEESQLKKLYVSVECINSNNAAEIIETIDYRFLGTKYIQTLGKEMFEQFALKPYLQKVLLEFSDKKYSLFIKGIESYKKTAETSDWRQIADLLLDVLKTGEYDELINEIEDLENFNIEKFVNIIQNNNFFTIKTLQEFEQYEEIKMQKCEEIMNSSADISRKREAVLQKIFGIDVENSRAILKKCGEDIESISDSDEKDFVLSLRAIMEVEDESILKQIYNECDGVGIVNIMAIVTKIKTAYAKTFNEGLYEVTDQNLLQIEKEISKIDEEIARETESAEPEKLQKLQKKKKDFEELRALDVKVYDAGVYFKMIITGIAPFDSSYKRFQNFNFKNDWNQIVLDIQHCCMCYIRNDMLGNAGGKIHYGFSKMQPDSLSNFSNQDANSIMYNRNGLEENVKFSDTIDIRMGVDKFYSPEKLINETIEYNEIDYLYMQSGKKIQPDYIIAFRKNGEIPNIELIKKAATEWGGELPIVIIDVDECLKEQKRKIDELLNLYNVQKTPELARKIIQKIKNNRKSTEGKEPFYEDSLITQLEKELENNRGENKVTKEDLAINSSFVTPQERNEALSAIKTTLQKIRTITTDRSEDNSVR